ncbi:hypothetical protein N9Y42_10970, partial [Mariniblastus sp.]|nr:hypothetical protein [Mariniblastus sp.]
MTDKQHTTKHTPRQAAVGPIAESRKQESPEPSVTISSSVPVFLNSKGQVLGISKRYREKAKNRFEKVIHPYSGWLYDSKTDRTYPILPMGINKDDLSVSVFSLSNDGTVLGKLRTPRQGPAPQTGFIWTQENGMVLLNETEVVNKKKAEWESFDAPVTLLENGSIIGLGQVTLRKGKKLGIYRQQVLFLLKPIANT